MVITTNTLFGALISLIWHQAGHRSVINPTRWYADDLEWPLTVISGTINSIYNVQSYVNNYFYCHIQQLGMLYDAEHDLFAIAKFVVVCFVLVEFGNMAKHTFVDKVFGGVFISSVLCHVCHVVRIICSVSCLSRDLLCFCLISSMCLVIYLSQLYLHTSQLVLQSCVLCACCLLGCF